VFVQALAAAKRDAARRPAPVVVGLTLYYIYIYIYIYITYVYVQALAAAKRDAARRPALVVVAPAAMLSGVLLVLGGDAGAEPVMPSEAAEQVLKRIENMIM